MTLRKILNILLLSKTYGLSSYDAAYFDLATRKQIPLSTLDKRSRLQPMKHAFLF